MKLRYVLIFLVILYAVFYIGAYYTRSSFQNLNCSDFDTQKKAQEALESYENDVFGLDANNDNQACEHLP